MNDFATRQALRYELAGTTQRLIAEFAAQVPAGTVSRCVSQAREELLRSGVRSGLAPAAEVMARAKLRTLL